MFNYWNIRELYHSWGWGVSFLPQKSPAHCCAHIVPGVTMTKAWNFCWFFHCRHPVHLEAWHFKRNHLIRRCSLFQTLYTHIALAPMCPIVLSQCFKVCVSLIPFISWSFSFVILECCLGFWSIYVASNCLPQLRLYLAHYAFVQMHHRCYSSVGMTVASGRILGESLRSGWKVWLNWSGSE
jgi:hypothetical protein